MLTCYALEKENQWGSRTGLFLSAALKIMEENPFANFSQMDIGASLQVEPYQRDKLLNELNEGKAEMVTLETQAPFPLNGSIVLSEAYNLLQVKADEKYFQNRNNITSVVGLLERMRKALPHFCWGCVDAYADILEFYRENQLPSLPECFGYQLSWFHIISPAGFSPYYEYQDLLKIPAHKIAALPQDNIAITVYENAFDYKNAAAQQQIIEVTRYLNDCRKN